VRSRIEPARGRAATARVHAAIVAVVLIAVPAGAQSALGEAQGARVHRKASSCRLATVPSLIQMGKAVTLKGKLKPRTARAVKAQVLVGRRWRVASGGRSAARTGAFRLKVRPTIGGRVSLRAYAPRTRRLAPAACRAVKVTVMAPDGSGGPAPLVPNPNPEPEPAPAAPSPPAVAGPEPGNSFRAVYAVASDQAAAAGKVPAIVNDIKVVNAWFATQTNNSVQPRWIRDKNGDGTPGDPTVVTVTLPHPASAYTGSGGLDVLADDLAATAPPAAASEKTVAWIDAGDYACGQTGRGVSVMWEPACNIHPSTSDTWPFGATYLLAHEMTHNFGAVPSCAPHYDGTAHVNDNPRDVLYQGPMARVWTDQKLDPGHDDYYDTGRPDCPGIDASPFWTGTADVGS
jgi:hypothetical protein